ncbi:uncharacterized protein LOC127799158 [Diospyros lotus]|uniref:uncharacterized protein LOC127799158 n=1 Tax=Diospyros lotus TaxID=55363 RepID=UPI0022541C3D|nr:uncharacterized protein LOC127799158 [Diospyros lotus]
MASFKFALVLASLLSLVNAQIPGCSIHGLELGLIEQCLNEAKSSISMDSCCTTLNQAVLAGLRCLCSLLPSSSALFSTPLPLPNCFALAPPLTQCQAPVLQPPPSPALPVLLPPDTPEEPPQEPDLLAPPPPLEAAVTAREMPPGGAAASDLNLSWSRSAILAVLIASTISFSVASQPPVAHGDCTDELVTFSQCLPYVSSSPNNASSSPSAQCCEVLSSASAAGNANCLCHIVQRPLLLGFPLNLTRLLSLSSVCPLWNHGSTENGSLETLCSGPGLLCSNSPAPPLMSLHPDPIDTSAATPSSLTEVPISMDIPATSSSAGRQTNNYRDSFPLEMIFFLVLVFLKLYGQIHH